MITDNDGQTSDATVTITITPVSDTTPVANADTITVAEGGTATLLDGGASSVLANDTGLGDTPVTVSLVTGPTQSAAFTLNADGTFSYTHNGSENFSDSFTYRVTDNDGQTSDATVTITITPVSDETPVANADTITVAEGGTATLLDGGASSVLANDTGLGDIPVTVSLVTGCDPISALHLNADGTFSYTHNGSENFSDSFTYRVTDNDGQTSDATVTINITPVSDQTPVANPDTITVAEGGTATVLDGGASSVLANDTGLGDIPVTVSLVSGPTQSSAFTLNADGTFSYTHNGTENFTDSFTYRLTDNDGQTSDATVTITINPINDNDPVATDDSITVDEGSTAATLDGGATSVLANDTDTDLPNDTLTVSLGTGPSHGSLTLNADGTFSYTHDGSENFTDSFTYVVSDADGGVTDTGTVNITINPINESPVINDQSFSVNENAANGTVVGTVAASDPDPGDTLTYAITGGNTGSTFAINASTGQITVNNSSALDFETTPTFNLTVEVTDSGAPGLTDTATVTINLNDLNETPIINDQSFSVNENAANGTVVGTVVASDPDAGDTLTYAITGGNTGGAFAINANTGQITVNNSSALDFETTPTFNLTVQVTDSGTPGLDRHGHGHDKP